MNITLWRRIAPNYKHMTNSQSSVACYINNIIAGLWCCLIILQPVTVCDREAVTHCCAVQRLQSTVSGYCLISVNVSVCVVQSECEMWPPLHVYGNSKRKMIASSPVPLIPSLTALSLVLLLSIPLSPFCLLAKGRQRRYLGGNLGICWVSPWEPRWHSAASFNLRGLYLTKPGNGHDWYDGVRFIPRAQGRYET